MGEELDWAAGVEHLRLADAFSVALYREIAAWLAPGRESRVLDAGWGAGGMTVQLAVAVGPPFFRRTARQGDCLVSSHPPHTSAQSRRPVR